MSKLEIENKTVLGDYEIYTTEVSNSIVKVSIEILKKDNFCFATFSLLFLSTLTAGTTGTTLASGLSSKYLPIRDAVSFYPIGSTMSTLTRLSANGNINISDRNSANISNGYTSGAILFYMTND